MYSAHDDQLFAGRVAPFGFPRIYARSQLPVDFRSPLRPSSLPDARAFTVRPYFLDPSFFPSVVKEHCKLAFKFASSQLSAVSLLELITDS